MVDVSTMAQLSVERNYYPISHYVFLYQISDMLTMTCYPMDNARGTILKSILCCFVAYSEYYGLL